VNGGGFRPCQGENQRSRGNEPASQAFASSDEIVRHASLLAQGIERKNVRYVQFEKIKKDEFQMKERRPKWTSFELEW
jgi:hypothetical protein